MYTDKNVVAAML